MNKDNHSEVKLLNKDVKVTDRDVWEFNAWIKGKKITPKLMKEFDSESDYEDFMLDYDESATYSVVKFPLDQPGVYQKDSEQYNYLSELDQGVYDQVITNLAKNGLKLEYDSLNDEFKVYSDGECKDGKCDLGNTKLECGTYDKSSDIYKVLSSLTDAGYEKVLSDLDNEGKVLNYDSMMDEFNVTEKVKTQSNKSEVLKPGTYKASTKEYKMLDSLEDDEWTDYLDELAKSGLSVDYDNLEDAFVVTGSDNFSKTMSAELGENSYMLVRYDALDPDFDSWYLDLMSEINPDFERLDKLSIGKSIKTKDWKITKLSDSEPLEKVYGRYVTEFTNAKINSSNFSDDGMTEVTFRTSNPEQLTKIVRTIGECGNGGHTFEIVIDPDLTEEEGGNIHIGWDGDGPDRIDLDSIKEFSEEREKVSEEMLEKAKEEGVVQQKPNGKWGIISIDAGEWWIPDYESKETAENALKAYHANKSESDRTFSNKLDLSNLTDDDLTGLALMFVDEDSLSDLDKLDYSELVSLLKECFKLYLPNYLVDQSKIYEIAHNLINLVNNN